MKSFPPTDSDIEIILFGFVSVSDVGAEVVLRGWC